MDPRNEAQHGSGRRRPGLVVLSPLLVAIAVAIRTSSRGPALFRQERIGKEGRPFTIWKFRTMYANADEHLAQLLAQHGRHDSPLFKVPNDPRITPLGRVLRKYSIDELPQFVNVLRGDMSLVGPRPQRAAEVEMYGSAEQRRLMIRPGVTGLWQVSGRSNIGWEEAIRLDLYYVENW